MEKATMTVKELSKAMGVSLPTAYAITDIEGFPVIKIGRRKVIPVDGFRRWLEQNSGKDFAAAEQGAKAVK